MTERKLATIRRIDAISQIEGADAIEVATVGGWKVVVKKGEFKENNLAIFCEIDSWIPHDLAPFLSKGTEPREYNGVKGERLRTVRLRKQISQGLLLPAGSAYPEGSDVTEALGIQKWEAPLPAQLAGMAKGNFPSIIPKTDQERIQNLSKEFHEWKDYTWEVTEKLEGSSMTCYLPLEGDFEVCSRNLSLKREGGTTFWKVAIEQNVENRMLLENLEGFALQGELIGEGIQGNIYQIKGHQFHVFDIYDTKTGAYLPSKERIAICTKLGLNHAPIVAQGMRLPETLQDVIDYSKGGSNLCVGQSREGLVWKCLEDPSISFKAINNDYLLKEK